MEVRDSFTPQPLYLWGNSPHYSLCRKLDVTEKRKFSCTCLEFNPDSVDTQPIA
jgi:hypothetical protein